MEGYARFVMSHRSVVVLAMVGILVWGTISWLRLPIDAFPDVTNNQVMILTQAPGFVPIDVEQQITHPVELAVNGLAGVTSVRSLSKPGLSQVVVVFEDDVDIYQARSMIFQRIEEVKEDLPSGIHPELGPISTGLGEIFQYTLTSESHSLQELRTLQDWLVAPRLLPIPGVNEVNSFGGFVKQYHVLVDPQKLLEHDLSLDEVASKVAEANGNVAGGYLVKGWEQQEVRTVGLFTSEGDIADVVLQAEDGAVITIDDVADVVVGSQPRTGAVTKDGTGEVVAGMVIMLKGSNSKEVVDAVKAAIPGIEGSLSDGISLEVFYDRTTLIEASIDTVLDALTHGALFIVLALFLLSGSLRAALTVTLSIPMTALATFVVMDLVGLTANLMSLGGLAIALGMVVDGAIVVTENTLRHFESPATEGTRTARTARALAEVGKPVVVAVGIVLMVFVPLFALEGIAGKMFAPLAMAIMAAMTASLLMAQTVVPVLASWILPARPSTKEPKGPGVLRRAYERLLGACLRHKAVTLTAAVVLMGAPIALVPGLGTEFLPALDEGAIAINIVRLSNASLEGSVTTASFIEKELMTFPEVATVVSKTGRPEISEDPMGPEQTDVMVMLHPVDEWTTGRTKEELVQAMATRLAKIPGIRPSFSQPISLRVNELISGVKSDLAVKIFGPDLTVLEEAQASIAEVLGGLEGAHDVKAEQLTGYTNVAITAKKSAMAFHGLTMADINDLVEVAVAGKEVTTFVEGEQRFAVVVRYPESARDDIEALGGLLLETPAGATVTLAEVASIDEEEGPATISREDGMRRVAVEVNVRGTDLGSFVEDAQAAIASIVAGLPPGYWVSYGGTFESQARAMGRLAILVPVALAIILVMLMGAFGKLRSALVVMAALPFALGGGVVTLAAAGLTLSVPAVIGFIALFGIAVQNGTVLVSFVTARRAQGLGKDEAIIRGASLRLRALMMTAATTIAGLVPMLYASGAGADLQRPLAVVVIGGLATVTVATVILTPVLLQIVDFGAKHPHRD